METNAGMAVEQETIAFVNTGAKEADFQRLCTAVSLLPTADVHVAFDGVANAGSFLLKANINVELTDILFTRISAIGDSGGGTLYILARR